MDCPTVLFWLLVAILVICGILVIRSLIKEEGLRSLLFPLGVAALAVAGIVWLQ